MDMEPIIIHTQSPYTRTLTYTHPHIQTHRATQQENTLHKIHLPWSPPPVPSSHHTAPEKNTHIIAQHFPCYPYFLLSIFSYKHSSKRPVPLTTIRLLLNPTPNPNLTLPEPLLLLF